MSPPSEPLITHSGAEPLIESCDTKRKDGQSADDVIPELDQSTVVREDILWSVLAAASNIVCQMAGMGILQLPYMLRQGGWLCLALIGTKHPCQTAVSE